MPQFIILIGITLGISSLLVFAVFGLIKNKKHLEQSVERTSCTKLNDLLMIVKENKQQAESLTPTRVKDAILAGMVVDQTAQFHFQEWFEVMRSFFSGMNKGQKSIELTLNPLQETDKDGHYHDSRIMLWFALINSIIYSCVFALKAFAKAFGKPKQDMFHIQENKIEKKENTNQVEKIENIEKKNYPVELIQKEEQSNLLDVSPKKLHHSKSLPTLQNDSALQKFTLFFRQHSRTKSFDLDSSLIEDFDIAQGLK